MSGTIVVGYDGSETAKTALAYAAACAGSDGRLVVAQVVTSPTMFMDTEYYDDALERARERGESSMRELEDLLGGTPAELHILEGPPARTLVGLAREKHADEIVVGSRGHSPGRALLGSVSHALLHETDRPLVILTRKATEREARRAVAGAGRDARGEVVGYDGSDTARRALEYAVARARGPITVVYAYDAPSSFLGDPYFGKALAASQMRGRELLDELEADASLPPGTELELLEGPPAEAVARAAMVRDADEIVVGSRGLGRFRGAFGSVSHALLHEADRPVVVVPEPRSG
ncbi:MAG TPA: universal stress protein [Thermoleophilaceae bacterium]|jgi:nucleotide-binding universal stress UspA family protein